MASRGFHNEVFIDQLAKDICRRGWRFPALVALEAARPLALLGGQVMWLAQPVLSLLFPREVIAQTAELLEEPAALSALIARLDTRDGS